jgi:flagellar hook-associated protein 2
MSISFGGLATGIDTQSLVAELLKAERRPIERMEADKKFYSSRLTAFTTFDSKLKALLGKLEALDTSAEVRSFKATAISQEFFTASTNSNALSGSYQVEVRNLAQVQKDVSPGYASKTEPAFGTGTLTLSVNSVDTEIEYSGASLTDLMKSINAADKGVTAAIINDGITGHRLVLSGADSATTFAVTATESVPGDYDPPSFTTTQPAQQAIIKVDGIEIRSRSNTFAEVIPGVSLTVAKVNEAGATTSVNVDADAEGIKQKVQEFVSAYNDVVSFISKEASASWGRDPAFRSAKGRLQELLVTHVGGSIGTLSQLGIKTQKDGTITLDSGKLTEAIKSDLAGVERLFAGEAGTEGIAGRFSSYLKGVTSSVDGLLVSRKNSTESARRSLDKSIDRTEMRLAQREKTIRAQFNALEKLVSSMNAQSAYVGQQMSMLNNLWSK